MGRRRYWWGAAFGVPLAIAAVTAATAAAPGPGNSRVAAASSRVTGVPAVRPGWLPAGFKQVLHRNDPGGSLDVYRTMTERERIETAHGAAIPSVAISVRRHSDRLLDVAHETVESAGRSYVLLSDVGPGIVLVWRYSDTHDVQVVTQRLSLDTTETIADRLTTS